MAPEIVAAIADRLAERAGFELPAWIVEARAASRIAALEVAPSEYVELIATSRGAIELEKLIEAVRVGESRLFRHRAQVAALVDDVLPALRASGNRTLKVWSAGCSTGEEPYTLAAVLSRALPGAAISVLATDVSADALAVARTAHYPAAAYADIPDAWRDAFVLDGELVRVRDDVAALVRFEHANLVDDGLRRGFDIVWCRNVLIYFTPAARRQVIDRLVASTRPGGYMFVGYSESLRDIAQLRAVRANEAVYYVRDAAAVLPPREAARVERPEQTPPPMRIPPAPPAADTLVLFGRPTARELAAELSARLGLDGMRRLVIELDPAQLLDDELAPVLARARAAARAAHIELVLHATRSGTRRWLTRHALDEETP